MKKLYNSLFLNTRLFYILAIVTVLFVVGFFVPIFFMISKVLLFILGILTVFDIVLLYSKAHGIVLERKLPERLSNGDENKVSLRLENRYNFGCYLMVLEELPYQFQRRDAVFNFQIKPADTKAITYKLQPTYRGVYNFGVSNVYASSILQLATRKYKLGKTEDIKCYPSFLQLNAFNIRSFSSAMNSYGAKKNRRIGHSLEFEQIKGYVSGDDIRSVNWKATAKSNQLMVNQYVEEKSQPIYSIIDKGRTMQLSFDGLTLLDYAINATLAISNIALRKQDKAGMFTFAAEMEDLIVAEQRNSQMTLISEALYAIKTNFYESDFSRLYAIVKRKITQRSLLILYTNFETMDALHRQLPYLRALSKNHLLLVVFFENTELNNVVNGNSKNIQQVYDSIIAEKFKFEKKQIVQELKKYGIQCVLTEPKNLTGETINKYLEFKSRGFF